MSKAANGSRVKIGILWFRNDLRVHDNLLIDQTIELISKKKIDKVLPLFCYDKDLFLGKSRLTKLPRSGTIRQNFIIECVESLRKNLFKQLNSNLFLIYGIPEFEIIKLIDKLAENDNLAHIEMVLTSKEINSEEIEMEDRLRTMLHERKISLKLIWDATMVHIDDLGFDLLGPDGFSMDKLVKATSLKGESNYNVRKPVNVPKNYSMPTYNLDAIIKIDYESFPKILSVPKPTHSSIEGMKGGEDAALTRLKYFIFESDGLKSYKYTRKGLIGKDYSSKLSIWMAYGCLGLRYVYSQIKLYEEQYGANPSTKHFTYELLIRDLFRFYSYKYRKRIFYLNGIHSKKYDPETQSSYFEPSTYVWKKDRELFDKWCKGETGYPLVDASMKELNETGYMSNRGRINAGSFLTRDLQIDWRWGAEYFETQLIDYDCGINWGMWKWVANVNGEDPEMHHFDVVKQGYDHDLNGDFVKMWLPQLVNVPNQFIHCPYRMGLVDQRRYKCILGRDYPLPIIKLNQEWKQNQIEKLTKPVTKPHKSNYENYLDFDNY